MGLHYENTLPESTAELQNIVDTITGYKTYSDRKKVDCMLEIAANLRSQLGTDSSQRDRDLVSKYCRVLYRGIKKVNSNIGNTLLRTQDGNE